MNYIYDINICCDSEECGVVCQPLVDELFSSEVEKPAVESRLSFLLSQRFIICQPKYVFDTEENRVYELHLNLEIIVSRFRQKYLDLINFLCNRTNGKHILLAYLYQTLTQLPEVFDMQAVFSLILKQNKSSSTGQLAKVDDSVRQNSSSKNVEQNEIHANLFLPLLTSANSLSPEALQARLCQCEALVLIYIAINSVNGIPIYYSIAEFLVEVLVRLGKISLIRQYIECGIFALTPNLARYLVKLCKNYPTLASAVMDVCCKTDCLDGLVELVGQTGHPYTLNRFIRVLSTIAPHDQNADKLNILAELKLTSISLSYSPLGLDSAEVEAIANFLKNASLANTIKKVFG